MNPSPIDPKDPKTWPVASVRGTMKELGPFHTTVPLTAEQKGWPVAPVRSEFHELGPFHFRCSDPRPRLVLTVRPPAGKSQEEVVEAMRELFVALVAYEAELGGTGLAFDLVDGPPGEMTWHITPEDPKWAASRVRALRAAVDRTADAATSPSQSARRVQAAVSLLERFQPVLSS